MGCGDIAWWREPDLVQLIERHGQAEHLVVQFNFCCQPWRAPRAEYSIPNAAKSLMNLATPGRTAPRGPTGYADIVCQETHEIWEIKPERLEDRAAGEAKWYVGRAVTSCGPAWVAGTSYSALPTYGTPDVVFAAQAPGVDARLVARQGKPGAVTYRWEINGSPVAVLDPGLARDLRGAILHSYFPDYALEPALAQRYVALRYAPALVRRGDCVPELDDHVDALTDAVAAGFAPRIPIGGSVAVLLDEPSFNTLVGPRVVARQVALMQVTKDWGRILAELAVNAVREIVSVLVKVGIVLGLAVAVGVIALSPTPAPLKVAAAVAAGGLILLTVSPAEAATAPAPTRTGLVGSLNNSIGTASLPSAVPSGGRLAVFAIPRGDGPTSSAPTTLSAVPVRYRFLNQQETGRVRVADPITIDGKTWYVAALARPTAGG